MQMRARQIVARQKRRRDIKLNSLVWVPTFRHFDPIGALLRPIDPSVTRDRHVDHDDAPAMAQANPNRRRNQRGPKDLRADCSTESIRRCIDYASRADLNHLALPSELDCQTAADCTPGKPAIHYLESCAENSHPAPATASRNRHTEYSHVARLHEHVPYTRELAEVRTGIWGNCPRRSKLLSRYWSSIGYFTHQVIYFTHQLIMAATSEREGRNELVAFHYQS